MDAYFTNEKIEQLVMNHNWEMVPANGGKYKLRQKNKHYMMTIDFEATEETAHKFCVAHNAKLTRRRSRSRGAPS